MTEPDPTKCPPAGVTAEAESDQPRWTLEREETLGAVAASVWRSSARQAGPTLDPVHLPVRALAVASGLHHEVVRRALTRLEVIGAISLEPDGRYWVEPAPEVGGLIEPELAHKTDSLARHGGRRPRKCRENKASDSAILENRDEKSSVVATESSCKIKRDDTRIGITITFKTCRNGIFWKIEPENPGIEIEQRFQGFREVRRGRASRTYASACARVLYTVAEGKGTFSSGSSDSIFLKKDRIPFRRAERISVFLGREENSKETQGLRKTGRSSGFDFEKKTIGVAHLTFKCATSVPSLHKPDAIVQKPDTGLSPTVWVQRRRLDPTWRQPADVPALDRQPCKRAKPVKAGQATAKPFDPWALREDEMNERQRLEAKRDQLDEIRKAADREDVAVLEPGAKPDLGQERSFEQALITLERTPRAPRRQWDQFCRQIPLRPHGLVKNAFTPNPPLLPPQGTEVQDFKTLARVWWTIMWAYFNIRDYRFKRAFVGLPGRPAQPWKSKHYRLLVDAAKRLRADKIPPVSWVRFRCDIWVELNSNDSDYALQIRPPSISFVFGTKGFDRHLGWYEHYSATYAGGTIMTGPIYRQLCADWNAMVTDCRLDVMTPVADIVERWFPNFSYRERVQAAQQESAQIQDRLNKMVARGEYVWKQYGPRGA